MCNKAFEEDPYALLAIPNRFKTQEVCDRAFEEGRYMLQFVPDYFITEEMYREFPDSIVDAYKKPKEQKALIREGILPIAWHPDRVINWCFDEDEKRDLNRLWY